LTFFFDPARKKERNRLSVCVNAWVNDDHNNDNDGNDDDHDDDKYNYEESIPELIDIYSVVDWYITSLSR
jgi:hypothetical protein